MPNKKKSDNWQLDCPGKKRGNVATQGREKKKKCNLNWGYLYKVHLSTFFVPHFPPKLGGRGVH